MILTCAAHMIQNQSKPNVGFVRRDEHLRQARSDLKLRVGGIFIDHRREQAALAAVQGAQPLIQRHDLVGAKRNPLCHIDVHVTAGGVLRAVTHGNGIS